MLYHTNPMNVIPESWEQESKTSLLHESLSHQMLGKTSYNTNRNSMQQAFEEKANKSQD